MGSGSHIMWTGLAILLAARVHCQDIGVEHSHDVGAVHSHDMGDVHSHGEGLKVKAVHEVCETSSDCPAMSTCKPTSCDGFTCRCEDGYVATSDRTACVKAMRMGEACNDTTSRCISEYAACMEGTCRCISGFQSTKDGRCKLPEVNFVGEQCGMCEFPAQCVQDMCKCVGDFRPLSTEEFWVDPISVLQCRPRTYSLNACNGTSLMSSIDTKSTLQLEELPPLLKNDWSLILPEKSIYDACNSHSQCPGSSRCQPNSCDGFMCVCNEGYMASEDRIQCLPAVKAGSTCDRRTDLCLSPFAKCEFGICKCSSKFTPTVDGRCRMANSRFVGETCRSSDECEYPGVCQNGKCACVTPQREITNEEFWIDPSLTIQCRPEEYSIWRCNGSVIDVPSQFHDDIPIDIEIELTFKHQESEHDDHDHKEVNPTILADGEREDDTFFVPLHIAGIVAAALFALLIACIFKSKRRKAIKRDISLTRANILANKSLTDDEMMASRQTMKMDDRTPSPSSTAVLVPQNSVLLPRPNVSIYNKNGWQMASGDGFGDVRSLYDNSPSEYQESNATTTRSTGPFIVDSSKSSPVRHHGSVMGMHGIHAARMSPYAMETLMKQAHTPHNAPYVVDGRTAYVLDANTGTMKSGQYVNSFNDSFRGGNGGHYANESFNVECHSEHDDLVMF